MSTLQEILDRIANNAPLSNAEIVQQQVMEFRKSEFYKKMELSEEYYKNETEIKKRTRRIVGTTAARLETDYLLANFKIPHGFYRKLTDQKVGYLMGKPFDVQAEGSEQYENELNKLFTYRFKRDLKRIAKDAIAGRGWMHAYINNEGKLAFRRLPPLQVVPLWVDEDESLLGGVIYSYTLTEYRVNNRIDIERFELWTTDGVEYFEIHPDRGGVMVPVLDENDKPVRQDHLIRIIEGKDPETGKPIEQTEGYNWERVPFIPFRHNPDEIPLIDMVKELIDDYDRKMSDISNQIEDIPAAILVVKNFSGTDPVQLREYIKKHRIVFVEENGGVDTLNQMLSIADGLVYLDAVRRDIFDFGRGVDTKSDKFTSAASGIAIKQIYQELDSDANDLETEFQLGMENLLWFINSYLGVVEPAIEIIFNRDLPINESEAIADAKNSVGILSEDTIISNHPWTKNRTEEKRRLKEEREEANRKQLETDYPLGGEEDDADEQL